MAPSSEEEVEEWLQHIKIGGEELFIVNERQSSP